MEIDNHNQQYNWKLGWIIGSIIIAAIVSNLFYIYLPIRDSYPELTVGSVTWDGGVKSIDYVLLYSFIGAFFISYLIISLISSRLKKLFGEGVEEYFNNLLILLSTPFGLWFFGLLVTDISSLILLKISSILIGLALIFFLFLSLNSGLTKKFNFLLPFTVYYEFILSLIAVNFSVIGICIGINRLSAMINAKFWIDGSFVFNAAILITVFLIILTIILLYKSNSINTFFKLNRTIIFLSQLFFPVFYLYLIPTPFFDNDRYYIFYKMNIAFTFFIIILFILSYFEQYWRYKKNNLSIENSIWYYITSLGLIALIVFLNTYQVGPPIINADNYHFGELVVPWWSMFEKNMLPLWDYSAVRGLSTYLPGAMANIFFNGTAASFSAVFPIIFVILLLFAFPIARWTVGPGVAFLMFSIGPSPWGYSGLLSVHIILVSFLALFCKGFLSWRPLTWLTFWTYGNFVIVLFSPGQGALYVLATSPLAIYNLYITFKEDWQLLFKCFLLVTMSLIIFSIFTPFGKMIFGAVRYGIEQSSLNSIAFGQNWVKSFGTCNYNPWLFEIVRSSWILITLLSGILILRNILNNTTNNKSNLIAFCLPIFILTTLFIVRSAGRIDTGCNPSRLGITTYWSLVYLTPLIIYATGWLNPSGKNIFVWISLTGIIIFFHPNIPGFKIRDGYGHSFRPIYLSRTSPGLIDGSVIGIPNLGVAMMDMQHKERLLAIGKILDTILTPEETYLDFTGHHADYFYFNRRLPIAEGSIYNCVSKYQQLRAIQSLKTIRPPVILLSADNIRHDGGPEGLRSYFLYRYIMTELNYRVVTVGSYIYLIRQDRLDQLSSFNIDSICNLGDSTANPIHLLFYLKNLKNLPLSWGLSFDSLVPDLHQIAEIPISNKFVTHSLKIDSTGLYSITGPDPYIRYDIQSLDIQGYKAGLLSFDFYCSDSKTQPVLELYWSSPNNSESEDTVLRFNGHNGKLLVPLDIDPSWLLSRKILSIRLDIMEGKKCQKIKITNLILHQRSNVDSIPPISFKFTDTCKSKISNTPFAFTDTNWHNGISRHKAGFFILLNQTNIDAFKVGKKILFPNGQLRKITSVTQNNTYLNVFLDGDVLDEEQVGFPNKFRVLDR